MWVSPVAIKLKQGDAYLMPLNITVNGGQLPASEVEAVEVRLGDVRKLYPEEISYDAETGHFLVPLRQKDTLSLPEDDAVQLDVRVKFKGGSVAGTQKVTMLVSVNALSEEVI